MNRHFVVGEVFVLCKTLTHIIVNIIDYIFKNVFSFFILPMIALLCNSYIKLTLK